MARIPGTEGMSDIEYCDLISMRVNDLRRRDKNGEDGRIIDREIAELKEYLRVFKDEVEAKKQANKPDVSTLVPTVEASVEEESEEEPEEEPEEDEEWDEEDFFDDEWLAAHDEDYVAYRQYLTQDEYNIIFNHRLNITEAQRSAFIYSLRHKNEVVKDFIEEWEAEHGVIQVIDPYNQVPKTEVVRDGDIITVRYVDGPPAGKQIQIVEEPEVVVDDDSKEVELDVISEPAVSITPEDFSPSTNGDVAHHSEPIIELSLDNARDELSIEPKEDGDQKLSDENLENDASVSIDGGAIVDRHREEGPTNVDFFTPDDQNSLAQSSTQIDFVFSTSAFQSNPDPPIADEEPTKMWNPLDFLFGIISLLKNGAKRLASKINRRRTKGALAQPFDTCD